MRRVFVLGCILIGTSAVAEVPTASGEKNVSGYAVVTGAVGVLLVGMGMFIAKVVPVLRNGKGRTGGRPSTDSQIREMHSFFFDRGGELNTMMQKGDKQNAQICGLLERQLEQGTEIKGCLQSHGDCLERIARGINGDSVSGGASSDDGGG